VEGEDGEGTVYLGVEDVLLLHADILGCSIEQARYHLRNTEGLEGAVARPLSHAHYAGADVSAQAAVLAHGIAEGQLFVDGSAVTGFHDTIGLLIVISAAGLVLAAFLTPRRGEPKSREEAEADIPIDDRAGSGTHISLQTRRG